MYDEFRTLPRNLLWLSITRSDVWSPANISLQVTNSSFSLKRVKAINKLICHVKDTAKRGLRYHCLKGSMLLLMAIKDES